MRSVFISCAFFGFSLINGALTDAGSFGDWTSITVPKTIRVLNGYDFELDDTDQSCSPKGRAIPRYEEVPLAQSSEFWEWMVSLGRVHSTDINFLKEKGYIKKN